MKTVVLDYETYYDSEYSLRKMTPIEYVHDPRFEIIGCAVKEGDGKSFWLEEDELRGYLRGLPEKTAIVSHNALFDACITSWKLGYIPHLTIDTLGMARAMLAHRLKSLSLNSVAMHLGLGVKGDTVHKVMGMNKAAIKAAGFYADYASYSCNDADLCWAIYRKLIEMGFPANEVGIMDTVLRCAMAPKFVLDWQLLAEHYHSVLAGKQSLLNRVNLASRDDLMSNDRFAGALRLLGVEPPTKISPVTGKEAFAFAKTDPAFIALEEHENPEVQALVAARLGIKSTIEETRTQRMMNIASITWPSYQQTGLMPMALRYSGAHTHRLSGDWKLNVQNLPSRGNNRIRSAIKAPPGYTVLAVDASQIEARIAAWFCGQHDMVQAFANKEDIYSSFASSVFNRPVNKKENPVERFIGKTAVLGLQYGLGWEKFQKTVALQSKAQVGKEVILTDSEAAGVVDTYRQKYRMIPVMWRTLTQIIPHMTGESLRRELGPVTFVKEKVILPSGLGLHYHKLHNKDGSWWFEFAGEAKYIYGGKMLENIVQALARIVVMDAALRVRRRLVTLTSDVWLNLQVHDELVYVVPDDLLKVVEAIVMEEMRRRPAWGVEIPLDAEAGSGPSYGDAK